MANTAEFYFGTDWESSSGPILSRAFHVADLWPVGLDSESDATGDKDLLADGLHPFVAIGPKALRPVNLVGVVMTYHLGTTIAEVNLAPGFCAKAYVANVLTYNGGNPATFDQSLAIGEPVYVDDSVPLDSGITLSRSPLNDAANGNPRAGYLFYDQDDYADYAVGGPNSAADWPKTVANSLIYTLVTVLLWPDAG
jgi:hypothetical protein